MYAFFIFRLGFTGAGGMAAMIWRVMFYEPSHLDGWTCMIPGTVGSLLLYDYVLLEILPTAKLSKRKLLVVANNVSTTFL
jgi:hypothetical protein